MESFPEFDFGSFREVLGPLLIRAEGSLNRLDSLIGTVSYADTIADAIALQEARNSCGIENIVTTQEDVFRAYFLGEGCSDEGVADVLAYHRAVSESWDRELSVPMMERICSALKRREMKIRSEPGDTVFLVAPDGRIISTPPDGERVPGLLSQVIEYASSSGDDPLLRMTVFHAYFEMVHPFRDGNGRTGRILNEVLLKQSGILRYPVLNLSRFLIENRREYYRQLRRLQAGGLWKDYLEFMLTCVYESAERSIAVTGEIVRLCREQAETDRVRIGMLSESVF